MFDVIPGRPKAYVTPEGALSLSGAGNHLRASEFRFLHFEFRSPTFAGHA